MKKKTSFLAGETRCPDASPVYRAWEKPGGCPDSDLVSSSSKLCSKPRAA